MKLHSVLLRLFVFVLFLPLQISLCILDKNIAFPRGTATILFDDLMWCVGLSFLWFWWVFLFACFLSGCSLSVKLTQAKGFHVT